MSNKRSIFEELNNYVPKRSNHQLVEAKANHVVSSVINLIELINETYNPEEAEMIEKKLLSSIKHRDITKFERVFSKIREGKE